MSPSHDEVASALKALEPTDENLHKHWAALERALEYRARDYSGLDLDAIEAACSEATKGPWAYEQDEYCKTRDATLGITTSDGITSIVETDSGVYPPTLADAAFICGARTWVPALVKLVRGYGMDRGMLESAIAKLAEENRRLGVELIDWQARVKSEREVCAALAGSTVLVGADVQGDANFSEDDPLSYTDALRRKIAAAIRARTREGGK